MSQRKLSLRSGPASISALVPSRRRRSPEWAGHARGRAFLERGHSPRQVSVLARQRYPDRLAKIRQNARRSQHRLPSRASPRALTSFAMRLFFELCPQLAFFHGLDSRARLPFSCFSSVWANCCSSSFRRLRWRSVHSVCKLFLFHGEVLRCRAWPHVFADSSSSAAAVQVSNQGRGLVALGRECSARPVDHVGGQTQPPRDIDATRSARHADHQAVGGPQVYFVELRPRR